MQAAPISETEGKKLVRHATLDALTNRLHVTSNCAGGFGCPCAVKAHDLMVALGKRGKAW